MVTADGEDPLQGITERSAMAAIAAAEVPSTPRVGDVDQLSPDSLKLQAALAGSESHFNELPREGFSAVRSYCRLRTHQTHPRRSTARGGPKR